MAGKKAAAKPKAAKAETLVDDGDFAYLGHGPVACGLHNSAAPHEFSTDDDDEAAPGFQNSCEDCQAQLEVVQDSLARNTTILV